MKDGARSSYVKTNSTHGIYSKITRTVCLLPSAVQIS